MPLTTIDTAPFPHVGCAAGTEGSNQVRLLRIRCGQNCRMRIC